MTVAGHDSLLDRPRPCRIALQKFLIVVRLDHQRVHLAQPFDQHLRRITELSNEPESAVCDVKGIADPVNGVMRYRAGLNGDIADVELGARLKDPPVLVLSESGSAARFGRFC